MSQTALVMVQNACAWLGLTPVPTAVFASLDPQVIQMRALLNEEQTELRKWGDTYWRKLIRQHTFTTTATDVQPANALPDDLDYIIPDSSWDRTASRPVVGPITPQTWQAWKARPVLTSVIYGFRLRGNDYLTAPNPPAGDTVAYEYISTLGVYSEGETTPDQEYFEADTDTSVFNSTLIERGLRWRFLRAKGLSYATEYEEWIKLLQREAARSKSAQTLNTAGNWSDMLPGPYVPSQNFPGSII